MLLKNGTSGEDVKKLQAKLGLAADGAFGPGTEAKVKAWQTANGLTADGIVGDGTWAKMFGAAAPAAVIPNSNFKLDKLKGHVPDSVIAQIPGTASKFNITTPLRLAHFLAQCGHESGNFKAVQENVNYSADGLKKIFGKYFPGNMADLYARNTGKSNYTNFTKFIGEDCVGNPDLVATKYPLASAAFFFDSNKLWSICDKGADDAAVTAVTKRVNGGTIGLADRIKHFKEFYSLLS